MKYKELSIDYESFSAVDLTKVGTSRYSRDESTEVLMAAYAFDRGPVKQWVPAEGEEMPDDLFEAMTDPRVIKWAWNAPFEMNITRNVLGIDIDTRQWRDTMVWATHCSLPGKLEKAGPVIGLPVDMQKDKRGKVLMRRFSFPRKPSKKNPSIRNHWHEFPEEWDGYKSYNRSDVVSERNIRYRLSKYPMPDDEWETWFLDQKINGRGLPINRGMVANAIQLYEEALGTVGDATTPPSGAFGEMAEITGLKNPNSNSQLLPWLQEHGYMFDDLKKGHVKRARDYFDKKPDHWEDEDWIAYRSNNGLKTVLDLRLSTSRTSIKKYYALDRATDDDGYLRFTLQMNGASRTARWAGRIYQPQNLPRPEKRFEEYQGVLADGIWQFDLDTLRMVHGDPFDALASALRPTAQAPEGYMLVDADLSAIENRVLGWLSGCEKILEVFRKNLDPYISFATYLYNQPYAVLWDEYKVQKKGEKRTIAKPGTLGCPRGDTLVLTDRGWVRLDQVRPADLVHDGVEWVSHGGTVNQGIQPCVNLSGVVITGDHKVWQGGEVWLEAESQDSRSWKTAIGVAASRLFDTSKTDPLLARYTSAAAIADATSSSEELASQTRIGRSGGVSIALDDSPARIGSVWVQSFLTFWRTASMLFGTAARTLNPPGMTDMAVAVSSVGSEARISSSRSASMSSVPTGHSKSTGRTTTVTTSLATFGSGIGPYRTPTDEIAIGSKSMVGGILRQSFGDFSRLVTEMIARWRERLAQGSARKKSSPVRRDAGDHTVWDIVNAGPRNRFVILSADGPCVIHNCGYGMGAGDSFVNHKTGEVEASGLLGYAWNMGVRQFTKEDAKHSVDTFRREFVEVKDYWYDLERAARRCVKTEKPTTCGVIRFEMQRPFLKMILPSGRALYYLRPRLEYVPTPWGDRRLQITYEGMNDRKQWVRLHTTPGKITENADQAISRDLLVHGMKLADKRGLDLRLHVHDQLVALELAEKASNALDVLRECMEEPPVWARDLPLGSAGLVTKYFMKD